MGERGRQDDASFQEYVCWSPLEGCYETQFRGHWKQLIGRSNSRGHLMAIVVMHPQQLTPGALVASEGGWRKTGPRQEPRSGVASWGLLSLDGLTSWEKDLLCPDREISTRTRDLHWEENCQARRRACWGTLSTAQGEPTTSPLSSSRHGTIGLTLARQLHTGLGMGVSAQATGDATHNAHLNAMASATHATRLAGQRRCFPSCAASSVLTTSCCRELRSASLSARAIRALHECSHIKRLVYISCQPEGTAMDNFVECWDEGRQRVVTTRGYSCC
ncbi:tRNA (uracil-5-)-methyltransferase homolog B-like [Haemaphysalis longicornis]